MAFHTFHVPVMGTGFTTDSPFRIAALGISSVVSLVDDVLIDQLRKVHSERLGKPYEPIEDEDGVARARRITAFLDLMDEDVQAQVARVKAAPFEPGSPIVRYFELLPDGPEKERYRSYLEAPDGPEKARIEAELRDDVRAGSIDANIMTKLDRATDLRGEPRAEHDSDALAALRGFALSTVNGAIVLSAGMNQRLFAYMAEFDDFFPVQGNRPKKRIILKVSDFRSAEIQAQLLARRGLWVSEFRMESGLNCGGHAFATDGHLMGPILAEFRDRRSELRRSLYETYAAALAAQGRSVPDAIPEQLVTAQGGVGTAAEHRMLLEHYGIDSVGWGTPFLLVPEVVRLDAETAERLRSARNGDVTLSSASPLGVPFWNLMTSPSEDARRARANAGRPGSRCPFGYLALNHDFGKVPMCVASAGYQRRRLRQLHNGDSHVDSPLRLEILSKSCICHDLGGAARRYYGIDQAATPSICPSPHIVHFSSVSTLEQMVDHIYGRTDVLQNEDRPHMFSTELRLYLEHLDKMPDGPGLSAVARRKRDKYVQNLVSGIRYYRGLAADGVLELTLAFRRQLDAAERRLTAPESTATAPVDAPADACPAT